MVNRTYSKRLPCRLVSAECAKLTCRKLTVRGQTLRFTPVYIFTRWDSASAMSGMKLDLSGDAAQVGHAEARF